MAELLYRRLRAPSDDGAALIDPALADAPAVLDRNRIQAASWNSSAWGSDLAALRSAARAHLLREALDFTSQYRDVDFVPAVSSATPLILAGHQPELFHPGVWFKNFLASSLAKRTRGVAINLIVDNDAVHAEAIRVPAAHAESAPVESVHVESVPFDEPGAKVPHEERAIKSYEIFSSFGARVRETLGSNAILAKPLWQAAQSAVRRGKGPHNLGLTLAEARHAVEGDLGLHTLELPLHSVCQSPPFRKFILQILSELPRLHEVYNQALAEYRAVNRVRSLAHPVPDLAMEGEWREAPLWIWTTANPQRRRAFVRQRAGVLEISDRVSANVRLSGHTSDSERMALAELGEAESRGIKLRPRALVTTMYARLVLSDLFIHGIGGAKYDELTDAIIRRFFEIEPPAYVTATATFRLPIDRPRVTVEDVRDMARRIRGVRYRPESLLADPRVTSDAALQEKLAARAAEKREYLATHDLRRCSQDVFDRLEAMNLAMYELLQPLERELLADERTLTAQLNQARVLGSRDFSFVLFPSEILPARLLDLCKVSS
jgi:hypothetical protein